MSNQQDQQDTVKLIASQGDNASNAPHAQIDAGGIGDKMRSLNLGDSPNRVFSAATLKQRI
jgi:hypothetical protein